MENLKIKTQEEQNTTIKNFKAGAGITFATDRDEFTISANGGGSAGGVSVLLTTAENVVNEAQQIIAQGGAVLYMNMQPTANVGVECQKYTFDSNGACTVTTDAILLTSADFEYLKYQAGGFSQYRDGSNGACIFGTNGVGIINLQTSTYNFDNTSSIWISSGAVNIEPSTPCKIFYIK